MSEKSSPARHEKYSGASQTQQARRETVQTIVELSSDLLQKAPVQVDLHDTEAVRRSAREMMQHCAQCGILPSVELLAAACGGSRRRIYNFLQLHPDHPTSILLDQLRTAFSAARIAAVDRGAADSTMSIFLLLNSSEGFSNTHSVEIVEPRNPLAVTAEEINAARKKYISALPELPDSEGDE
uniref:Uncharacterized protein n=1 Tax=uncultured bacterium Contig1777 TaxID=1393514 RepID=W0FQL2_9BACT|nr:hypothetical protein [uncultured bacterium Contig1777]